MAQPPFVPQQGPLSVRHYSSPPRRARSWWARRPGDLADAAPAAGEGQGHQGPDQGYALELAKAFTPLLRLSEGESANDVVAGCVTVALKRASLLGRAPIAEDLQVAFERWGFLDDPPPSPRRLSERRRRFAGAGGHDGYAQRRRIAESVPAAELGVPAVG